MASVLGAPPDYRSATTGLAFSFRSDRRVLKVTGKAPGEMLKGLLTNRLPSRYESLGGGGGSPSEKESDRKGFPEGAAAGEVVYSALLTPKGKMLTDMRVLLSSEGGYLLDLPAAGVEGAMAHFRKYLPPRLASVEASSGEMAVLTLLGPQGPGVLAAFLAGGLAPETMAGLFETMDASLELFLPRTSFGPTRITRNDDLRTPAWDVLSHSGGIRELGVRLEAGGAEIATEKTLRILRIERGRPAFGEDMTEETIPVEAGIQERAIDYGKGCYTGQEVIVRIRDRGAVNKHLRGLVLGEAPVPDRGEKLFEPGTERPVGWITSACRSPAFGQTLALAYLARRVAPGDELRLSGPGGAPAEVRALEGDPWPVP